MYCSFQSSPTQTGTLLLLVRSSRSSRSMLPYVLLGRHGHPWPYKQIIFSRQPFLATEEHAHTRIMHAPVLKPSSAQWCTVQMSACLCMRYVYTENNGRTRTGLRAAAGTCEHDHAWPHVTNENAERLTFCCCINVKRLQRRIWRRVAAWRHTFVLGAGKRKVSRKSTDYRIINCEIVPFLYSKSSPQAACSLVVVVALPWTILRGDVWARPCAPCILRVSMFYRTYQSIICYYLSWIGMMLYQIVLYHVWVRDVYSYMIAWVWTRLCTRCKLY